MKLDRGLHRESQRIALQFPVFQNDPNLQKMAPDAASDAHHILLRLLFLNVLVLLGAGVASYWLARRTPGATARLLMNSRSVLRPMPATSYVHHSRHCVWRVRSLCLHAKTPASELRQTLKSNLKEVTKLDTLINNLLRLTQLEADELQQHFEQVSSKDVVETALGQVSKLAAARKITLHHTVADAIIMGDQESLVQIVVILLDNAIKYSSEGKTVTLAAIKEKDEGYLAHK